MPEALALLLVPSRRFLDVPFGLFAKLNGDNHSRFRRSAKEISAERPVSPSAS